MAEFFARGSKFLDLHKGLADGIRAFDEDALTKVLQPNLFIKADDDILSRGTIHHVFPKALPHGLIVGSETDRDIVLTPEMCIWVGGVVDITPEGLKLVSSQPIEINRVFRLVLNLPAGIKEARRLVFEAQSLWRRPDVNPDLYVTGFQFLTVSPGDIAVIQNLIRQYELPNP